MNVCNPLLHSIISSVSIPAPIVQASENILPIRNTFTNKKVNPEFSATDKHVKSGKWILSFNYSMEYEYRIFWVAEFIYKQ